MPYKRIKCNNREDWLARRLEIGLGASQSAAALGISPFQSNVGLWEELTGKKPHANLDGNPAVEYGKKAEEHIRALFALENPQFQVDYNEFDILQSIEYPWLFATLDGELTVIEDGSKGVLEIKTSTPRNAAAWAEWKDQIPQHYFVQVLHQLIVTGYDFAVLRARLRGLDTVIEREYRFNREDYAEDMEFLISKTRDFMKSVENNVKPYAILPEI